MSQTETGKATAADERTEAARSFVRTVKAATRRKYTPEEKIRIVLEGFRREVTVSDLCRREGIKPHSYYWASTLSSTFSGPVNLVMVPQHLVESFLGIPPLGAEHGPLRHVQSGGHLGPGPAFIYLEQDPRPGDGLGGTPASPDHPPEPSLFLCCQPDSVFPLHHDHPHVPQPFVYPQGSIPSGLMYLLTIPVWPNTSAVERQCLFRRFNAFHAPRQMTAHRQQQARRQLRRLELRSLTPLSLIQQIQGPRRSHRLRRLRQFQRLLLLCHPSSLVKSPLASIHPPGFAPIKPFAPRPLFAN